MSALMTISDIAGGWFVASIPLACLVGALFASRDEDVDHDPAGVVPCSTNAGLGVSNPGASGPATTNH